MEIETPSYRSILIQELGRRKTKNRHYSMRAFARDLGLSVTVLSEVLANKRRFSPKNAMQVDEKLALAPALARRLSQASREQATPDPEEDRYFQIQDDIFATISDWYHFAIMSLARLPRNQTSPQWIANRLGISAFEAEAAVARLQRLGLLSIDEGRLVRTEKSLQTTTDVPSSALRKFHRQHLQLAEVALERVPVHLRDITSVTLAVDPQFMSLAKPLIQRFRKQMERLARSETPKEVYTLAIQFYPLTQSGDAP